MKQGYSKQQALKQIQQDLAAKFPEDYLIGIENDHITIRRAQNRPANMGKTLINAFGGASNALKMMENIKKGIGKAYDGDRHGASNEEAGQEETGAGQDNS